MRFSATLVSPHQSNKILNPENAIEFFRKMCQESPKEIITVSHIFLKLGQKLEELNNNHRLKAVTKITHARLLGVAIKLCDVLNNQEKKDTLDQWEKVTFLIFGLARKDSRTKVGDYVKCAKLVYSFSSMKPEPAKRFYWRINKKISNLTQGFSAQDSVKNLGNANCYEGWEDELIYFFRRYEEYLSREEGGTISEEVWEQVWRSSPNKTIEHIHPQKLNTFWKGKIPMEKNDEIKKQIHRLGNLTILPPDVNTKASNRAFQTKKEIYKNNRNLRLIEEIILEDDWDLNAIERRENRLIEWAVKEWSME